MAIGSGACPSGGGGGSGTPVGFSGGAGDRWEFPLVGALEDGLLVTPITIDGHGPYLFALDPDATMSVIDAAVVKDAHLVAMKGLPRVDESGAQAPRAYAEVTALELGSLVVERRDVIVVKTGTFDAAGRAIHGVIGRDILADSLVLGFDRDQGLGYVMAPKAFKPAPDAIAVPYTLLANRSNQVAPRRIAKVTIGGETFSMHVDLGATPSQLREAHWERAKLVSREVKAFTIDETGSVRSVAKASELASVTLGTAQNDHVAFIPFEDKRWDEGTIDGTLGLGFFGPYTVWIDTAAKTYYLSKRHPAPAKTRFARWDSGALDRCTTPGCLAVRLIDPLAGKPVEEGKTHPGLVLSLTREERAGGMALEVTLEPHGRPDLPLLIVSLPPNVDRLIDHLPPEFVGVTLEAVDASPYPRPCPNSNGCIDKLSR